MVDFTKRDEVTTPKKTNHLVNTLFLCFVAALLMGGFWYTMGNPWSTEEVHGNAADIDIDDISQLSAREQAITLSLVKKMQTKMDRALEMERRGVPFKPTLSLQPYQNKLCLAIALFTETEGEAYEAKEINAWAIVNRAIDSRRDDLYKSNVCAAVIATSQFSGMAPYKVNINDVVWGNISTFTPQVAKVSKDSMAAWQDCLEIAKNLIDGKLSRKTLATHFISPRGMLGSPFPSWVADLKPVSVKGDQGLHIYFRDYGWDKETGEIVYFSKNTPYDSKKHR